MNFCNGGVNMIISRSIIQSLINFHCPYNHELISSMKLHLTLFVAYAKAYDEVRDSIYWNGSNVCTRRRVTEKLNRLAFEAMSSLLDAANLYNQFLDYCEFNNLPKYDWLLNASYSFQESYNILLKEHFIECNYIQLSLL